MTQAASGFLNLVGRRWFHGAHEVADGHRRDQRAARLGAPCPVRPGHLDRLHPAAVMVDPRDARLQVGVDAVRRREVAAAFPHHARPEAGVVEALDQARDDLAAARAVPDEGIDDGGLEIQFLIRCAAQAALICEHGMPQTFSV